jgi:hypothetical protein
MKYITILIIILIVSISAQQMYAQTVGISNTEHSPDTNAVLDVYSTNKGMFIPRVLDSTAISNPDKGMLAYFTTTQSIWFHDSLKWCQIVATNKSDTIKLGATNNYVRIEPDGSVFLVGDATMYDDLMVPVLSTVKGTSAPPDDITVLSNFILYGFDKAKSEEIFFVVQLPHSYKEGSDIYPHIHWMPTNTNTGVVVWKLEYTWVNYQGTYPSSTTIMATDTASGTANTHQIGKFGSIDGTGMKISSMLICRLYREGGNAADTYNADAAMLEFDFHFEVNSVGSRLHYTK